MVNESRGVRVLVRYIVVNVTLLPYVEKAVKIFSFGTQIFVIKQARLSLYLYDT